MSGPDYAWWHGMYDVAKAFYTEFLPEVKRVAGSEVYGELMKKYVEPDVRHEWYLKGMSKDSSRRSRRTTRAVTAGKARRRSSPQQLS